MAIIQTQSYDDYINSEYPYNSELYLNTDATAINTVDIELKVEWWVLEGTNSAKKYETETSQSIVIPTHERVGMVLTPLYMYRLPYERFEDRFGTVGPFLHATLGANYLVDQYSIKYINNDNIYPIDLPKFPSSPVSIELYEPMFPEPIQTGIIEIDATEMILFGIAGDGASPGSQVWDITINIPCFKTNEDLEDYLRTGNLDKAIENRYRPTDISLFNTLWYWEYEEDTINTKNQVINRGNVDKKEFKLPDGYAVAWVRVANNLYSLESNSDIVYLGLEAGGWSVVSFSSIKREIYKGSFNNNKIGDIYTNIPFVESLDEVIANSLDDANNAFNGVDSSMNLTSIETVGSFIRPYYITKNEANNIATILFSSDADFITTLKEGLWMYNENPIECVVDFCFYPFDLTPFIAGNVESKKLKFGSFEYNGELSAVSQVNYSCVKGTPGTLTLVNQRIKPIYNDYRDYSGVNYTLFLPYFGLINLNNIIVGKTLRVDAKLDIFTAQLKYYIFADNTLLTTCECAVGQHHAVLGTDWISKSSKNLDAGINLLSNVASATTSASVGNIGGIIGGMTGIIDSYRAYEEKPSVQTSGSSSSGLNIYDPMTCYLITEQYETIKPANLISEYGMPCYFIDTINKCSGYVQISDVKLQTTASQSEYEEIVSILKNGFMI